MDKHALYQLTVKAIVNKNGKILLLNTKDFIFDFPGGRVNNSEVDLNLKEVLKRELNEELGNDFKFEVQDLAFVTRRRYNRHDHDHRVIAVFFNVNFTSGEIVLSGEHGSSEWINPKDILDTPKKFMSEDEYEQYSKYFNKNRTDERRYT